MIKMNMLGEHFSLIYYTWEDEAEFLKALELLKDELNVTERPQHGINLIRKQKEETSNE